MCESLGVYAFIEKRVKEDNDSAIKGSYLFCSHWSGFNYFSIWASNNSDFKAILMQSVLSNRDQPSLNKNSQSLSLELFNDWRT